MRIDPKKIMCAIDFSEFTNLILTYGRSLANRFESTLVLCHIIPDVPIVSSHMAPYLAYIGTEEERIANARTRLEELADDLGLDCDIQVSVGHPADEIDRIAAENGIGMVIAATYGGSGIKRFLVGSVTSRLVKILACPLLVLHAREKDMEAPVKAGIKLEQILVGCDFSRDSGLAFDYALGLAQEFQTRLHMVHVTRPVDIRPVIPGELGALDYIAAQKTVDPAELEKRLSDMVPEDSRNFCTPVTAVLEGEPYQALLEYAKKENIDMIVLGIRGHGLLEQFLVGSTTDRVISRAACPVLAVRHIEADSGKQKGD